MDWAIITTWYVVINLFLMFIYTLITAIGGGFDLFYLLKELSNKDVDEQDDGRVISTSQNNQ